MPGKVLPGRGGVRHFGWSDGVLPHSLLGETKPSADEFEAILTDVLPVPPT